MPWQCIHQIWPRQKLAVAWELVLRCAPEQATTMPLCRRQHDKEWSTMTEMADLIIGQSLPGVGFTADFVWFLLTFFVTRLSVVFRCRLGDKKATRGRCARPTCLLNVVWPWVLDQGQLKQLCSHIKRAAHFETPWKVRETTFIYVNVFVSLASYWFEHVAKTLYPRAWSMSSTQFKYPIVKTRYYHHISNPT